MRRRSNPGSLARTGLTGCLLALLACLWIGVVPGMAAEPARVLLRIEAGDDGPRRATARVVDAEGAPAPEVPVTFRARMTFGWLVLADTSTDAAGVASVLLPPGLLATDIGAEAQGERSVLAVVRSGAPRPAADLIRPGRDILSRLSPQPGFISPYPVPLQVALLALILGGIWSTYGYVAWLLMRIRRRT